MPELLIIKPSALRDIVHGLQVSATIKAQQPAWRISWKAPIPSSPLPACPESSNTGDSHISAV